MSLFISTLCALILILKQSLIQLKFIFRSQNLRVLFHQSQFRNTIVGCVIKFYYFGVTAAIRAIFTLGCRD